MPEVLSPSVNDIRRDVGLILWSLRLHHVRRYTGSRFWAKEALDAQYADRLETRPRLESVSEHSWHVADTVLLLAPYFPFLDLGRCLALSILHDKMEIIIGDLNPLGRDGTGQKTHAFNMEKRVRKDQAEQIAIMRYSEMLRPSTRAYQIELLQEMLEVQSEESRFVKAVDKLQALAFIIHKKRGDLEDRHIDFLLRFTRQNTNRFPGLHGHQEELFRRLLKQVARRRQITVTHLLHTLAINNSQLELFKSDVADEPSEAK